MIDMRQAGTNRTISPRDGTIGHKQTNNKDLLEKDCGTKILAYTWNNGLAFKVSLVHIDCC